MSNLFHPIRGSKQVVVLVAELYDDTSWFHSRLPYNLDMLLCYFVVAESSNDDGDDVVATNRAASTCDRVYNYFHDMQPP